MVAEKVAGKVAPATNQVHGHDTARNSFVVESIDESIVAFATVREKAMSSEPAFGEWRMPLKGTTYGEDIVPCMVEVSQGSPNKYEVDKETGMLVLDRVLHSAVHYPGDYGYIPATLCGDGDPLDLLIISPYSAQEYQGLEPGVVAKCRMVGIMDMEDESGRDEKIIAVLADSRTSAHIESLETIPPHLVREIQHFFENYKVLEKKHGKAKWARVLGWGSRERALEVLRDSRKAYEEKKKEASGRPQRFETDLWAPNMLHVPQRELKDEGVAYAYINVPKGTTTAYSYRHDTSFRHYRFTLDMPSPGDMGFVAQTWDRDNLRPATVQILSGFPLVSECLVKIRFIGALKVTYKDFRGNTVVDRKFIGTPYNDPRTEHVVTLTNINKHIVDHYVRFYEHHNHVSGYHGFKVVARLGAAEALDEIRRFHQQYAEDFPDRKIYNAPNLWCLPWGFNETSDTNASFLNAVIECPKGDCNKYEFNKEFGSLVLERPLHSATHWPGNYGFIPQTVAEDGRPVNVLVLSNHKLNEFSLCNVRVMGALLCLDERGPDLKVVAVPKKEPRMSEWTDVGVIPKHLKDEMENFFNTYKSLELSWRFCKVQRWVSRDETMSYLRLAHTRFFLFVLPMERVDHRLKKLEDENVALKSRLRLQPKL
ncbi:Inorganic pyrophosphatase [Diplonema papillatum]|nr:Inorganic pyrophosphatase [Diplonema papillatum]